MTLSEWSKSLPLRDVHGLMAEALGPAENQTEVTRQTVAFLAIAAGRETTGLTRGEEVRVRTAIEKAKGGI